MPKITVDLQDAVVAMFGVAQAACEASGGNPQFATGFATALAGVITSLAHASAPVETMERPVPQMATRDDYCPSPQCSASRSARYSDEDYVSYSRRTLGPRWGICSGG